MKPPAYKRPVRPATRRRVYVLPSDLVERVRKYGQDNQHASETAAARALLEESLTKWEKTRQ